MDGSGIRRSARRVGRVGPARRELARPRTWPCRCSVLLVPIALLLLFYRFVLDGDEPVKVDPGADGWRPRGRANVFPISGADRPRRGLEAGEQQRRGSRSTGGREAADRGTSSPDGGGVSRWCRPTAPVDSFLKPIELTAGSARPQGNVDVGAGTAWQIYTARPGERGAGAVGAGGVRSSCSAPPHRTSCASSRRR